jgi:hypothetical protein
MLDSEHRADERIVCRLCAEQAVERQPIEAADVFDGGRDITGAEGRIDFHSSLLVGRRLIGSPIIAELADPRAPAV